MSMNFSVAGTPAIGSVIASGRNEVTSMSYHEKGERLYVASAADSQLQVIDCLNGKAMGPPLRCEREKIKLVQATYVICHLIAGFVFYRQFNQLKSLVSQSVSQSANSKLYCIFCLLACLLDFSIQRKTKLPATAITKIVFYLPVPVHQHSP